MIFSINYLVAIFRINPFTEADSLKRLILIFKIEASDIYASNISQFTEQYLSNEIIEISFNYAIYNNKEF